MINHLYTDLESVNLSPNDKTKWLARGPRLGCSAPK